MAMGEGMAPRALVEVLDNRRGPKIKESLNLFSQGDFENQLGSYGASLQKNSHTEP